MSTNKVKAIVNEMEKMRSKAMESLKEQFFAHLRTYFEKYPDLETIGIIGYTPGFNDGDPCTYSCQSDVYGIKINGFNFDAAHDNKKRHKEIAKDVAEFTSAFPDDFYYQLFGDNTETIFKRDGSQESEYYDCGY